MSWLMRQVFLPIQPRPAARARERSSNGRGVDADAVFVIGSERYGQLVEVAAKDGRGSRRRGRSVKSRPHRPVKAEDRMRGVVELRDHDDGSGRREDVAGIGTDTGAVIGQVAHFAGEAAGDPVEVIGMIGGGGRGRDPASSKPQLLARLRTSRAVIV